MEQALKLKTGNRVVAGNNTVRLIAEPETNIREGRQIARLTAADDFLRTRIYTHDEIEFLFDEACN
ncbi:MAG: hypothetical protein WCP20_21000 [Desulfuromonadales bacterium]